MTTETTTPAERAKQISDRLLEIGPYPESIDNATAQRVACYLAVRAQVIWRQQISTGAVTDHQRIDLMTILFAASHALFAAHDRDRAHADLVAREIWGAWEDGGGVGDLLRRMLGSETCAEAGTLAEELAAIEKAASEPSPAARAVDDAEQVEATAAVLNRRYPSARPEQLDATISDLQAIARSWRRQAAQVEAADKAAEAEATP